MGALFPSEVKVYIGAAGAAATDCTEFTTLMTSFKEGGGDKPVETISLFGGASINNEKPREQIEVSFEGIIQYDNKPLFFDQLVMGSSLDGTTAVDSSMEPEAKVVYLEWSDGTNTVTRAYNNVVGVSFAPEMSADEYLKGEVTLKLSPTDASGNPNKKVVADAASTITW